CMTNPASPPRPIESGPHHRKKFTTSIKTYATCLLNEELEPCTRLPRALGGASLDPRDPILKVRVEHEWSSDARPTWATPGSSSRNRQRPPRGAAYLLRRLF